MRHAQAQLEQYGQNDRERAITMVGMHEIEAIRQKIQGKLQDVSYILCSNAKRTRQTLDGIRQILPNTAEISYDDGLYQASVSNLWRKIQGAPSKHSTVMMMAHNPGVTEFIDAVAPALFKVFPTCGVAIFETSVNSWVEFSPYNTKVIEFVAA